MENFQGEKSKDCVEDGKAESVNAGYEKHDDDDVAEDCRQIDDECLK